ncbi:hypothetical protein ACFT7S_25520, partial [Streptomyces sp. NPDC057136]|uniref:hypothetical protein n=1 Tax=Streptomyces sp. NPDC057136 TaxID=3346029 RepID=UPI00363DCBCD
SRFTGALRALPFVLAFPTLSDSFVSDSRSKRAPCRAGEFLLRFPVLRFRVSLSGGSNLTRFISFRFRSEFDSGGLLEGLCLSADPTLSETFRPIERPDDFKIKRIDGSAEALGFRYEQDELNR